MDNGNGINNGKTLGTVGAILALIALIGGVTAIVRPMEQEIAAARSEGYQGRDALRLEIERLQRWQDDYAGHRIPSAAAPELAEIKQRFVEIETQFRNLRELLGIQSELMKKFDTIVYENRERLVVLEAHRAEETRR